MRVVWSPATGLRTRWRRARRRRSARNPRPLVRPERLDRAHGSAPGWEERREKRHGEKKERGSGERHGIRWARKTLTSRRLLNDSRMARVGKVEHTIHGKDGKISAKNSRFAPVLAPTRELLEHSSGRKRDIDTNLWCRFHYPCRS